MADLGYPGSPSFTEYFIFLKLTGCEIGMVLIGIYFAADYWTLAGSIALSLFLAFVLIILLKQLVEFLHMKSNVETLKRKRNEMLIGLGGITLSSYIQRILVFFFAGNNQVLIYTGYLSLGSIYFFFLIFLLPRNPNYIVDYFINGTRYWVPSIIILDILLLIFTITLGIEFYPKNLESDIIIYFQFVYSVIDVFSLLDFFQVLRGGFKLNTDENGPKFFCRFFRKY